LTKEHQALKHRLATAQQECAEVMQQVHMYQQREEHYSKQAETLSIQNSELQVCFEWLPFQV